MIGSISAVATDRPEMVLTFDDGPEPGGTDAVLQALDSHQATATFFVLMNRVQRHPGLLAEVAAAGHEVALHGPDHRAISTFSPAEVRNRTQAAKDDLEDRLGTQVRWFRPPYGRQTLRTWRAVQVTGLETVLWGPTSWDWREIDNDARVTKSLDGAGPGAILLCHDGTAGPDDGAPDPGLSPIDRRDLIDRVLAGYAERGWSACSLGRALERGTAIRLASFSR